nr:MAG TPA: hypothetical protein [Caudoviricetes sp.]
MRYHKSRSLSRVAIYCVDSSIETQDIVVEIFVQNAHIHRPV